MDALKAKIKRDEKGHFLPGNPPGPGRPMGQSLKEYWRERFSKMTDEEKADFSLKVDPKFLWAMAEGNPPQKLQGDSDAPLIVQLMQYGNGDDPAQS